MNPPSAVDDRIRIVGAPHAAGPTHVILQLCAPANEVPQGFLISQQPLRIDARLRKQRATQRRAVENRGDRPSPEAIPGIALAQARDEAAIGKEYLAAQGRHDGIGEQLQDKSQATREPLLVT